MTKLHILVLIGALVALSYGQNNVELPPEPTKAHPTTAAPTTHAPTTSPPTQPPTTSKSTAAPTTSKSTPAPTTTSVPTTTPASTHAPTTPKPTPPPTPAPEPKPDEPTTGTWHVVNDTKTNTSCLLLQFALQIQIPYNPTPNKTYHGFVDIPSNASASGVCGNENQSIILEWTEDQNITDKIILNFARNTTTKKYGLTDIEVTITPDAKHFPDFNGTGVLNLHHKYDEFRTSLSKSYKCAKKQELNLTDDANTRIGIIYVSHLQFEAFANSTNKQFSSAEDCAPFDTPDVVPIAVGCALAALVIVVLIAYLIGRRRRQARGYLSMFTETKRESDYIPMKNLSCFQ